MLQKISLFVALACYVAICALFFLFGSILQYTQMTLYTNLTYPARADHFFETFSPLTRITTPTLMYVCRDLMSRPSVPHREVGQIEKLVKPEAWPAIKNLELCEPILVMRGDSLDYALLGRQYAYQWALTNLSGTKEAALKYLDKSRSMSPLRKDVGAINEQTRIYLGM